MIFDLAYIVVAPMASFSLKVSLLHKLFRFRESQPKTRDSDSSFDHGEMCAELDRYKKRKLTESIVHNFTASKRIPLIGYFRVSFKCFDKSKRIKKYRVALRKANSRIQKEMDF